MIVALAGAHLASAQTSNVAHLAVQTGNGQVLCILQGCTLQTWQPISVKATDANGNPVAGATVSWNVTGGSITLGGASSASSVTGTDGIATQNLSQTILQYTASPGTSYIVNNIQAICNGNPVTFTETQDLINASTPSSEIELSSVTYNGQGLTDADLRANAGSKGSIPILVRVAGLDIASNGVPNVAVRIVNAQASPTLTCDNAGGYADPGSVLTDSTGLATCIPVFSGSGSGTFYITIGGLASNDITTALYLAEIPQYSGNLSGFPFTSIPGTATAIQIVSGNNQVGSVGVPLNPLVARVVDVNGFAVSGQTVLANELPRGSVTLGIGPFVSDNSGQVSIPVTLQSLAAAGATVTLSLQTNPAISTIFQETLQGSLTAMNKVSGDQQTTQPGANFANPLVVQLVNGNSPLVNYPVQYMVSGSVTLSANTVNTDATGKASVTAKAGAITGTVTVTAVAGTSTQSFTLTIASGPTPTGVTIVSGNNQSAVIGTQFPQSLTVQVTSASGPVSGVTVGFTTSGAVNLSSAAATTNSSGQASVTATAGTTTGPVTVTASISGFQATFNLTVTPTGPQLNSSSFLNAASRQTGPLSPCGLAILTAPGLTPDPGIADLTTGPIFGRWPRKFNNFSITLGGVPAPIKTIAMGTTNPEVTFQVPCEVTPAASVPVVINVNGGGTATTNVAVASVGPGIFQQTMSDGVVRAVAVRSDGTFVDIGNPDQYDPNNPARLGEVVRFYLTGLGPTNPVVGTGSIENPNSYLVGADAVVNGTVTANFVGSNLPIPIVSARQAPGQIGVYEIQVTIPNNAPTGSNVQFTVSITSGSTTATAPNSTIPIQ